MKKYLALIITFLLSHNTIASTDLLTPGSKISHAWTENSFPQNWKNPTFETFICENNTLVWNNTTDTNNPTSGREKYTAVELAPKLLQVSWKESPETTNYGIIWTLDFNNMTIRGVLVNINPNQNYVVAGEFSIVKAQTSTRLKACH
jgi:hypothetical protein